MQHKHAKRKGRAGAAGFASAHRAIQRSRKRNPAERMEAEQRATRISRKMLLFRLPRCAVRVSACVVFLFVSWLLLFSSPRALFSLLTSQEIPPDPVVVHGCCSTRVSRR